MKRDAEKWRAAYRREAAARTACVDEIGRWRDLALKRGSRLDDARDLIEATDLTPPEAVEPVLARVLKIVGG